MNEWIKVKRGSKIELPEGTVVEVMFKNEKIVTATINGNWFVCNPKELEVEDLILGVSKYRIK